MELVGFLSVREERAFNRKESIGALEVLSDHIFVVCSSCELTENLDPRS